MTVFISYSRKDKRMAQQLHDDLEFRGITSWLDLRDIDPGQKWATEITTAIEKCEFFLLLLSPDAMASDYVKLEYTLALELNKHLIPLLFKKCEVPDELAAIQYVDLQYYGSGITRLLHILPVTKQNNRKLDLEKYLEGSKDAKISALAEIGYKKQYELSERVIVALKDQNDEVRSAAAFALDQLSMPDSIDVLCKALEDNSVSVRSAAGWALVHLGEIVVPAVGNVLCNSNNHEARAMAHLILTNIGSQEALKLIKACNDKR